MKMIWYVRFHLLTQHRIEWKEFANDVLGLNDSKKKLGKSTLVVLIDIKTTLLSYLGYRTL